MTIFDRFKAKQEQAQATARERYYALRARIDLNETNEQDADELETLMRDLNVSHARSSSAAPPNEAEPPRPLDVSAGNSSSSSQRLFPPALRDFHRSFNMRAP